MVVGLFGANMPDISQLTITYSGTRIQGALVGTRKQMSEIMELVTNKQVRYKYERGWWRELGASVLFGYQFENEILSPPSYHATRMLTVMT